VIRIPATIQMGPYTYEVKLVETDIRSKEDRPLYGEADYQQQVIRVDARHPPDTIQAVFIHEYLHVIDIVLQLELSERQIGALAPFLLDLFRKITGGDGDAL